MRQLTPSIFATTLRALVLLLTCAVASAQHKPIVIVQHGEGCNVADLAGVAFASVNALATDNGAKALLPNHLRHRPLQYSTVLIGRGDFRIDVIVMLQSFKGSGAAITFDSSAVLLDEASHEFMLRGAVFGGGVLPLGIGRSSKVPVGMPFSLSIARVAASVVLSVNGEDLEAIDMPDIAFGRLGFDLGNGNMRVLSAIADGDITTAARPIALFSAADGAIDEHRDPVIAASATEALALAIAVTTADDGSVATNIRARTINMEGAMSPARDLVIDAIKPDVIALAHDGTQWILLVQEWSDARVVEAVSVYASNDGTRFTRIATALSTAQPLGLAPTALVRNTSGSLIAYASRLVDGVRQAASIEQTRNGDWIVRERHPDDNTAATKVRPAWGCPAGNACCATLADATLTDATLPNTTLQVFELQVFEGGDSAEREHVLFVRLPRSFATKVVP